MRGEPINALKTAMINTFQYINDDNYIGILDELLAILADSDDRARTHNLSGRDTLSPLTSWDTSNVTSMGSTFKECSALSDLSPIANWNTSHVKSMRKMFYGCYSLKDASPIKDWDISNVTDRYLMFYNTHCKDVFASAA